MASRNSMLAKFLEDCPNCDSQSSNSIKNESSTRDLNDLFGCSSFLSNYTNNHSKTYTNSQPQLNYQSSSISSSTLLNRMNSHHNNLPNTSSFFTNNHANNDQQLFASTISTSQPSERNKMNNLNLQLTCKSQNVSLFSREMCADCG